MRILDMNRSRIDHIGNERACWKKNEFPNSQINVTKSIQYDLTINV